MSSLGEWSEEVFSTFYKRSHTYLMVLPPFRSMIFYIKISLNTLQDVLQV